MSRSPTTYRVKVTSEVVHTLKPWFLSLTVDTSVLIGGRWWGSSKGTKEGLAKDRTPPLDLDNPELARWAQALAPATLRIGGTEADRILYGFQNDGAPGRLPVDPNTFVLKGKRWKALNQWAADRGFQVLFTVAAGPETRDADGHWDSTGTERLLRNTTRKGYPVVAWEFGNEVNAFPFLYGWERAVTRRQYLKDFARFSHLVRTLAPGTRALGPASAIWPLIGEPNPFLAALGRSPAASFLDALSFHYYPQQSSRGRVAVRRAQQNTLLNARTLDGALRWVRHARRALSHGPAATAPLWITEMGHALYGGEAGISDTWLSTPWWLDQLGLLAHAGVESVFRQSLVGGDYGLLDPTDFSPRPDYFASLLWKNCMGPHVFAQPEIQGPNRLLRAWHHGQEEGRQCLLLINLQKSREAAVELKEQPLGVRILEPQGAKNSRSVLLNGVPLRGPEGLQLALAREPGPVPLGPVRIPPLGCAFVSL